MSCLPAPRRNANPALAFVEAGTGDAVLLLHGSTGTGAIWRQTLAALQSRYRVVAPDLIGYGRSAAWPSGAAYSIEDEVRALSPLLPCCGEPYHLVGYSHPVDLLQALTAQLEADAERRPR